MTKYLIAALVLALGYISIQEVKINNETDRADRWESNFDEMSEEVKSLSMTTREFKSRMNDSIRTLLDSLDVKPKEVERIVEIVQVVRDTTKIKVPVFVKTPALDSVPGTYEFTHSPKCFKIEGFVTSMVPPKDVTFTNVDYQNKSRVVYFWQRRKWKFLGLFKTRLFGKKEQYKEVVSDCGKSYMEEIEVTKK